MERRSIVVDRISDLPEGLVHYIFSFLETKSMVQASILSKKWRYMWMTTPYLNLNLDTCGKRKKRRFINFVDRVLLFRGSSTVYKFSLCCEEELEADRICTWLMTVLRRGIQELCLESGSIHPVQLPHDLFTSSITVMKLKSISLCKYVLPNSVCTNSRITSLELVRVELPEGNANGELKFSFMVLKNFIIRRFNYGDLNSFTLFAPQLERLEVSNLFGDRDGPTKIDICTPKLISFIYTGYLYGEYFVDNLQELISAEIYLWECRVLSKEMYPQYIKNLLTAVHSVKKLTITNTLLKTFAGFPYLLETVTNSFRNLRIIKLVDWTSSCIRTITSFLERLPLIETFIWSTNSKVPELGTPDEGDGGENSYSCLKTIKISSCHGNEYELKLLQILLKKSLFLEEVIIRKSKSSTLDLTKFRKFRKKLAKLPQASSSVSISYRF
ncbi:hypothetical protein ACHQM5_026898 [Ranunculus cassubicifolius]